MSTRSTLAAKSLKGALRPWASSSSHASSSSSSSSSSSQALRHLFTSSSSTADAALTSRSVSSSSAPSSSGSTFSNPFGSFSAIKPRVIGPPASEPFRTRPLTFPLGTLLGFFIGFSAAAFSGYVYLLASHQELSRETKKKLVELEQATKEVDQLTRSGFVVEKDVEVLRARIEGGIEGIEARWRKQQEVMDRIERRVQGMEEESLETRKKVWKLGKHAPTIEAIEKSTQASSSPSPKPVSPKTIASSTTPSAVQQNPRQTSETPQGPQERRHGVLWTGQSSPSARLV